MNEGKLTNDRSNLHPHISLVARITILLGILSIISVLLALSTAFLVMRAGIYTYPSTGREYLYPLFWLLWLPLPMMTIICGSYARRTTTEHGRRDLASIGLVFGYLSLTIIGAIVLAEISLFFLSLGCTPDSPCS
jgi:hypothetical protein